MNPSPTPSRSQASLARKLTFYAGCRAETFRRWCYGRILDYRHRPLARHFVLWERPLIIHAAFHPRALLPLPPGSLLLLALHWTAEELDYFAAVDEFLRTQRARSPNVRIVILANTPAEVDRFTATGHEAVFISHNAFLDERVFTIHPEIPRHYDAVYDAQLNPYKRHYLAADIPSLALISYLYRPSPDLAYARTTRRELARAVWINDPLAKNYRRLKPAEVCEALNAARVGLCLSEIEGAMYASAQYLLCGLPVVTTPSKGGRDCFFDPDFALTVAPERPAVAAGVAEMIRRAPDPQSIRNRTVERMKAMRSRFVAIVQEHLDRHAPGANYRERFDREFFHTLLRYEKPERFWIGPARGRSQTS